MDTRLGAVSYLNTIPLVHFLDQKPLLAPPATLARLLLDRELDVATAPIVALFENPHYSLIPGVCIGSKGSVQSVKLFFNSPDLDINNINSISLDTESNTSVLLLKVLLRFCFKRDLKAIRFQDSQNSKPTDARLLIGDKALIEPQSSPALDLGEAWTKWTRLPFVFAAWISRHDKVDEGLIRKLNQARDKGMGALEDIIPSHPQLSREVILSYLQNLNYSLGPKEMEGIQLFKKYVMQLRQEVHG